MYIIKSHYRGILYLFKQIVIVLEQAWILASPRSLSAQDPSQPKILVSPRSQSTQDPSQPKIPVSPRSQSALDALMPIWHLAHAYLIFGSCLFGIWLMQCYLAHLKFTSTKFFKHILHLRANLVFVCIFSFSFNTVIISRHF